MIYKKNYKGIRLCFKEANALITELKSTSSVISRSILKRRSAERRDSPIVDLREVFVSFNFENERSAEAVVTGSVRHSMYRHAHCKKCGVLAHQTSSV